MTTYREQIDYINDGEPVSAGVTNRPLRALADNVTYLRDQLSQASGGASDVLAGVVVRTDVTPGMPVYYNHLTAQYEPAQAVAGQDAAVGVCLQKPYGVANLADLVVNGTAALDITTVLDIGESLAAGRYFLSASAPGKLTQTRPADLQVSVLIADGLGRVFVLPQDHSVGGAQGPQGYFGYQGLVGYQGAAGTAGPQGVAGLGVLLDDPAGDSTTDANVELALLTGDDGLFFVGAVKNVGVANALIVREEVTDAFGVTVTLETTVAASGSRVLSCDAAISTGRPPYTSYRVLVRSALAGTPTGYEFRLARAG